MPRHFGYYVIQLVAAVFAANLLASNVIAATPNPAAEATVKAGKISYNAGDYAAAILSFKQAYAARADSEVLYQLGKAYAMGDWPAEAVETFERYLGAAGPNLTAKRKLEVADAIEGQKRRIGTLALEITPIDAKVVLDETAIEPAQRSSPLPVRQGAHVVAVSRDGYHTQVHSVQVPGKSSKLVKIALVQVTPPLYDGLLELRCRMPGVTVRIDDRLVATTPVDGPLLVPEGSHQLRLERPGYVAQTSAVAIARAKTTEVECDLHVDQPLASSGNLELEFAQAGALVLIDGKPKPKSNALPPGLHSVEIRHYGFEPWTRELRVDAGSTSRVTVELTPTPGYLHDVEQRAQSRRTLSYVLGSTGIAVAGAALAVGLWNHGRFQDWKKERSELEADYKATGRDAPTAAELEPRRVDANDQLRSIHAIDIVTAILGATGGMLVGSSTVLYFTAEHSQPQRGSALAVTSASLATGMKVAW